MKVAILTNFSYPSICGVWNRARQEAELIARHHDVRIFSSNSIKGTKLRSKKEESLGNLKLMRFSSIKLAGEGFLYWNFKKELLRYKPNVIIAHSYRQLHTLSGLRIAKKLKCKIFLVTHAPFVEGNITRSWLTTFGVRFYDAFIAPRTINKFDKIIVITKWEVPILLKIGVEENKIVYIPNGIPDKFFKEKKYKEENKILFLGRIAPIKNIETLIKAMSLLEDKKINLEIVGPAEENYLDKLKLLIKENKLENRVIFTQAINDVIEKLKKIDSANIFVLPSIRESMPQALIEAMAREKTVIASNNKGCSELIEDGKNGYLFKVGDYEDLARKIDYVLKNNSLGREAKKSVEQFSWGTVIKKTLDLIEK